MANIGDLRAMVVDDNPHMRVILMAILKSFGITQLVEVSNGAEALDRIRSWTPDVVFLDLLMQPVDGIELSIIIRNSIDSPNPELPIVVVSGNAEMSKVSEARDVGVTEFLAKPVSPKDVLRRLQAVIYEPRSFVRTNAYYGPDRRRAGRKAYNGPPRRAGDQPGGPAAIEVAPGALPPEA